jgi:plasmid stabilization system protein ParE
VKVIFLPQAQADLDEIKEPLISKIRKRLATLGSYPSLGSPLYGPLAGYRATVVGHFKIVYKRAPGAVEVSYIRDCRRS